MGRVLLAAALLAAASGVAAAGPTRKVRIETEPAGATVYLNSPEDAPVCAATPCTIDAPIGSTTIILRLDKYDPVIDTLDVKRARDRKPMVARFKLASAVGTIAIESAAAKGATVRVDEEDKGKVPARIETDAGGHHVVVILGGKTLYDDYVNVEVGQVLDVTPKAGEAAKDPPDEDGGGDHGSDDGEGHGSDTSTEISKPAPEAPRKRFITVGAMFEVGFRHFEYDAPKGGLAPYEDESGQAMVGPAIELWPAELAKLPYLHGLSLFFRIEFGLNHQAVLYTMGGTAAGPTTFWGSVEASVRNRWTFAGKLGLEVSGGFARDQMQFNASLMSDLLKVPVADYKTLRLGVRAALAGKIEPYLGIETRVVLSGGDLPSRFDQSSGSGFRAGLGVTTNVGPFAVRAEASYLSYSWKFSYDGVNDVAEADGASDTVKMLSLSAGYQY